MASIAALARMRGEADERLAKGINALSKRLKLEIAEPRYERDPEYAAAQRAAYLADVIDAINGALPAEETATAQEAAAPTEPIKEPGVEPVPADEVEDKPKRAKAK